MSACRWQELGMATTVFDHELRQLVVDPGGWTSESAGKVYNHAVNVAIAGRVVFGTVVDLGPKTEHQTTPINDPIPEFRFATGFYTENTPRPIVVPVANDWEGEATVQVWAASVYTEAGKDPVWEWGRVNARGDAMKLSAQLGAARHTSPQPEPPPTTLATKTAMIGWARRWEAGQHEDVDESRIKLARVLLETSDTRADRMKRAEIRRILLG